MIMTPTYMMFPHNLCTRAGLKLVTVPTDDSSDPDFDADVESSVSKVVEKLEAVYLTAQKCKIRTRVLLLCNPCNPILSSYASRNRSLLCPSRNAPGSRRNQRHVKLPITRRRA